MILNVTFLLNNFDNGKLQINFSHFENTYENEIASLNQRIADLEEEVNEKTVHLNRTINSSESFKELVLDAEIALNKKIEEQSETIQQLEKQIYSQQEARDDPCEACAEYVAEIVKMSKSIELKTLEMNSHEAQISELRERIKTLTQELSQGKETPQILNPVVHDKPKETTVHRKKHQILMVSDSQGRHSGNIMRQLFDSEKYSTLSICKPNASFEAIADTAYEMTKNFTKEDYVIMLGGSNNALENKAIAPNILKSNNDRLSNTNVILILTPF